MVKVERSFPAPASLELEKKKTNGNYRLPDVSEHLKKDFHNKCYICEMDNLQDPQIEHRLPHHGGKNKEREFDWNNLFWVCGHCNIVKNQRKYDEGIIDCCIKDPEKLLCQCVLDDKVIVSSVSGENDIETKNTVMLINEVFNKDNTGMRKAKCAERYRLLLNEMNVLYRVLECYNRAENKGSCRMALRALLDKKSAFAAFKREYIRDHKEQYPELVNLVT